jgi:hypothetical protein
MALQALRYTRGSLEVLDQRLLPLQSVYVPIADPQAAHAAICSLAVRGAPAIALAAALSLAVELASPGAVSGFASGDAATGAVRGGLCAACAAACARTPALNPQAEVAPTRCAPAQPSSPPGCSSSSTGAARTSRAAARAILRPR